MACTTAAPSTGQLHNCCCRQQPAATRRPPGQEQPGAALPPAQEHTALAHTQARPSQRHMNHPTLLKTLVFPDPRIQLHCSTRRTHLSQSKLSWIMCSTGAHPPTAPTVPAAAQPAQLPHQLSQEGAARCLTQPAIHLDQQLSNATGAVPHASQAALLPGGHAHAPCSAGALLAHNLLQQLATYRPWQQQQQPANRPCLHRQGFTSHPCLACIQPCCASRARQQFRCIATCSSQAAGLSRTGARHLGPAQPSPAPLLHLR